METVDWVGWSAVAVAASVLFIALAGGAILLYNRARR